MQFDKDYAKPVPWEKVTPAGEARTSEMVDAVAEVPDCEENNREQRRKKHAERSQDLFYRACPGPLPDGSCRMPEETCNHPHCMARG